MTGLYINLEAVWANITADSNNVPGPLAVGVRRLRDRIVIEQSFNTGRHTAHSGMV